MPPVFSFIGIGLAGWLACWLGACCIGIGLRERTDRRGQCDGGAEEEKESSGESEELHFCWWIDVILLGPKV